MEAETRFVAQRNAAYRPGRRAQGELQTVLVTTCSVRSHLNRRHIRNAEGTTRAFGGGRGRPQLSKFGPGRFQKSMALI